MCIIHNIYIYIYIYTHTWKVYVYYSLQGAADTPNHPTKILPAKIP